jgi:hypothetical protein
MRTTNWPKRNWQQSTGAARAALSVTAQARGGFHPALGKCGTDSDNLTAGSAKLVWGQKLDWSPSCISLGHCLLASATRFKADGWGLKMISSEASHKIEAPHSLPIMLFMNEHNRFVIDVRNDNTTSKYSIIKLLIMNGLFLDRSIG